MIGTPCHLVDRLAAVLVEDEDERAAEHGDDAELDPDQRDRAVGHAGSGAARAVPERGAAETARMISEHHPAAPDRQVAVLQRDQLGHLDAEEAAGADDDEREPLVAQEQTQRHDERRDADSRHEEAYERADEEPEAEAEQQRERPGDAELRVEHDEQRHADAAGDTGGEVDLAEQQDEDQRHAEHDERGGLVQQVGEVALGEEERAERSRTAGSARSGRRQRAGRPCRRRGLAATRPGSGRRGRPRRRCR